MRATLLLSLCLAPLLIGNAPVADGGQPDDTKVPIPAAIRSMLDAAIESGNDGDVSVVVKYARLADPASADAVLAIAQKWRSDRAQARQTTIRQASIFDLWSGRAELGGYITTGNTDSKGGSAILDLTREGLQWRHKFHVQADYQENANITTREHYLASYEPNYKINDRLYVYGAAQYEADRFLGYYHRYSASAGVGYSAIKSLAEGIKKAGSTDTEKLITSFKGLQVPTPFGRITYRPEDNQSTMGGYIGRTKNEGGKGVMVDYVYLDGADAKYQPSAADVKKSRSAD